MLRCQIEAPMCSRAEVTTDLLGTATLMRNAGALGCRRPRARRPRARFFLRWRCAKSCRPQQPRRARTSHRSSRNRAQREEVPRVVRRHEDVEGGDGPRLATVGATKVEHLAGHAFPVRSADRPADSVRERDVRLRWCSLRTLDRCDELRRSRESTRSAPFASAPDVRDPA